MGQLFECGCVDRLWEFVEAEELGKFSQNNDFESKNTENLFCKIMTFIL